MFVGAKCRPADRQCFSTVITRIQRPCCASILPPHAPPVLGRSLSVSQQSGTARQLAYSAPLLGTASPWSYLPLFLQGLQASVCGSDSPLLSSTAAQRPRHFLASSSQTLPGRQDTAVPAVGTDSVSHRRSVRQHTPPPRIRAARHRLCRFTPRTSDVVKYLDS